MSTTNYNIPYLDPNQTQKEDVYNDGINIVDTELKALDDRATALESGGGTGGTSYDDTELRGRIEQNELDITALQDADTTITQNINDLDVEVTQNGEDISTLNTFHLSITNRAYNTEQKNIEQDNEIDSIDTRLQSLEAGGGSGYDDSEVRSLISQNYTYIQDLETTVTSNNNSISSIVSKNNNQDTAIDNHEGRITTLEEGFDPVDLTPLIQRIDDVESGFSDVLTNVNNLNTSFSDLEQNVNTFDSRINSNDSEISNLDTRITTLENEDNTYDDTELRNRITTSESDIDTLQLSDTQQNTDIDNLDTRVTTLEQSSGGTSYDDTELRGRIETNETDIDALELNDAQQDSDIDSLQTTTQNHETRITTLESGGGTGGGGEMPQTGEVRKFLESNIPQDWYKISEYPYPKDSGIDWLVANANVSNRSVYDKSYLKTTSSFNTFSLYSGGLYIFNRNTKDFDLIQSNIGFSGDVENNIFNKDGSNMAYIYNINSDESITLLDYNLSENTYTTFTSDAPITSERLYNDSSVTLIDKNHENIYSILRTGSNNSICVLKTNILNKTFEYNIFDTGSILTSSERYRNSKMIYFNSSGNIVIQYKSQSLEIDKDDITIVNDYTNNHNSLYSTIKLNSIESFNGESDLVWSGDHQFIIARGNSEIAMIDNYSQIIYRDLFNINLNNFNNQSAISMIFFDIDSNVYCVPAISLNTTLLLAKNRLFNTSNVTSNNFVDCVYNVPQ